MEPVAAGESRAGDQEDLSQEIEEIKRHSLGDQLRTGFFGQDACVQTDVSELPLVKRLSDESAQLVKEMETLKKETAVKVKFIEAQYESRLQQEAETLYTGMNHKVKAFENLHKEKVAVLRNSFRQQFADAVEVIKASYKNYCVEKDEALEVDPGEARRVQDLLNELQEKDVEIRSLSKQLRENEERALTEMGPEPADDPEKDWLRTENDRLSDDVNSLHVEMEQIRQALEAKDQSLKEMALNVSQLQLKAEDSRKALQQLAGENDQLKVQLNLEKENGRMQICQLKQKMEKETESPGNSRQNQRVLNAKEADSNNKDLAEELEKLKRAEKSQRQHVDRLQKTLAVNNQAWEKKFEILRQSFHAIKDEMFLRQSLQRQAAALHQAAVNYTNAPVSNQDQSPEDSSFQRTSFSTKAPLPSISARETHTVRIKTVDIHLPCVETDPFSASEAQLASDDSDEDPASP